MGPHLLLSANVAAIAGMDVADGRPLLKKQPDEESLSAQWWPLNDMLAKVRSPEANSFFRECQEMRVHFEIIAAQCKPAPIASIALVSGGTDSACPTTQAK